MFYVIQWLATYDSGEQHLRGPYMVEKGERNGKTTLEWGTGGYMPWPENADVLATYSCEWDEAEIRFYKEFYPITPSDPIYSQGWVAPNGLFYPCSYGEHDRLATRITACLMEMLGSTRFLEEQGWLRITSSSVGYTKQPPPTPEQLNTLVDLASQSDDWKDNLLDFVQLHSD